MLSLTGADMNEIRISPSLSIPFSLFTFSAYLYSNSFPTNSRIALAMSAASWSVSYDCESESHNLDAASETACARARAFYNDLAT